MPEALQHVREADRVRAATAPQINRRIDRKARLRLHRAALQGKDDLTSRIAEAGRAWDFDRVIEVEAAVTGLAGLILGMLVNRRFLAVPGVVAGMMLLHSTHGWYPLLPILRRLGVRSQDEIDREYYALKALRGDFDGLAGASADQRAQAAWRAVTL